MVICGAPGAPVDGHGIQVDDVARLGAVAGLADDRVLAEILRVQPFDGSNLFKGIVPFGYRKNGADPGATVAPSGNPDGSIVVSPFRAIIGSRNVPGTAPTNDPAGSFAPPALQNWRDIRTGIFVGSALALTQAIALAPCPTNSRWDLVYATLSLDANGPSATRRVKSPSTSAVSSVSIPSWVQSFVSVTVLAGTPGASPALPTIPADSGSSYNVPIAYVYVPNGFTGGSTVLAKNIRAYSTALSAFMKPGLVVEPAGGNNDRVGTYATNFGWGTSGRPGPFMSPDMVGGKMIVAEIDASNATPSLWSHPPGTIVDSSCDWRNRFIFTAWAVDMTSSLATSSLATDPAGPGNGQRRVPTPGLPNPANAWNTGFQFGSTFGNVSIGFANDTLLSTHPSVCVLSGALASGFPTGGGTGCGLYVESTTGTLHFSALSSAAYGRLAFFVMASGYFPNF